MSKESIEQGKADYKGKFHLFGEQEGGLKEPLTSGVRPQHQINGSTHTSGLMSFIDKDIVLPGEKALVYTTLLSPEAYKGALKAGSKINIYSGSKKIGEVTLIEIYNPILGNNC